jgi:hypothetical protein
MTFNTSIRMKKTSHCIFLMLLIQMFSMSYLASNEIPPYFKKEFNSSGGFEVLAQMNEMNFYSQASQDKFVYAILYDLLGKQDQGYYLEIGAGEPIQINNSYFFEKNLQWVGTSIDISAHFVDRWYSVRNNLLLIEDATKSDYKTILESFPQVIDYLSLDVDGFYTDILEKIPFSDHIFKVITIEHDFYRFGDLYRGKERQILTSLGYYLLCSDVSNDGNAFEDWWIHPSAFPPSVFSVLISLDLNVKDHKELIQTIQDTIYHCSQN